MSEPLWTSAEIVAATGGKLVDGDQWSVNGISIDSRSIAAGDLFVALNVDRDGHDFVEAALKAGAGGSLVSKADVSGAKVLVKDTQKSLELLGAAGRDRSGATRIAITGSVGKTSVKDALSSILSEDAATHSSIKSYNNQWGVPLTLARMPKNSQWGIFEIGTSNPGEIAPLSKLVCPHLALITRIAEAHLAGFGSTEAIAREKASIWAALDTNGIAVLPGEGPGVSTLRAQINNFGVQHVWTFGESKNCDVQILNWDTSPDGSKGRFCVRGQNVDILSPVTGMHWGQVLASVMATAVACGKDPADVAEKMKNVRATKGRGGWVKLALKRGSATLIDDSYNANPASMKSALDTLSRFPASRKLAVLGQMLELGAQGPRLHAELVWPVENAKVDKVWCVGDLMQSLYQKLPKSRRVQVENDVADLAKAIYADLQDGDVLLVKGSNGSGVHQVVAKLKQIAQEREI